MKDTIANNEYIAEVSLELNNLLEIDLRWKKIREIKENSFYTLNNLRKLNLTAKRITEINENSFNGLINLHELDLHYNTIRKIKENSFISLNNVLLKSTLSNDYAKKSSSTIDLFKVGK